MKKYFYIVTALIALASCSTNDYVGDQALADANNGQAAITFNSGSQGLTRADKSGSAAATDLDNHFYVYGIKNESSDGAGNVGSGNLVYNNYVVNWVNNSAYTTTSNTKGWEYVGYALDANEQTQVVVNSGDAAQTIKYWDWGASDYTFYAVSAAATDITGKKVKFTKNQTATSSVYDNGYTVNLSTGYNLDKLFFAERVNIVRSTGDNATNTNRNAKNTYGGNVTFRFHNLATKVRVGMYETIPGYKVTITKFSVDNDGENPAFSAMTDDVTTNFAANLQNCTSGTTGAVTVTFVADGENKNYPTVSFDGAKAKVLALGVGLKENIDLKTTSATPTWDNSGNYTSMFPNEANTQNLKLKISYKLTAANTNEVINVNNATAEIPASYLKWKPGYAYTYIFKISDNTNGQTGTGDTPAGLYPITFDATEVIADDGTAEYITTVSEPSITTYAKGSAVTTNGEYKSGEKIYAVVEDGSSMPTLTAENMKLYTVTSTDATNFPITEASVAEALIEAPTLTKAQADAAKIKCVASSFTYGKTVVDEAGNTVQMDASNNVVADFTTAASTVYAIQYIKTAATYTNDGGKTYADASAFAAAGTLYTDAGCTSVASSWSSGTTYYKRTGVSTQGKYAYKIVKVKAD